MRGMVPCFELFPICGLLPLQVAKCLGKIAGMSVEQVERAYGLPTRRDAHILHTRATDMTTRGFEWTLVRALCVVGAGGWGFSREGLTQGW